MQICKTLYLKYILKHQGDSEVELKLTAHHVVKSKKSYVQVGYGCEHTSNIITYPTLAHTYLPPTMSNDLLCAVG